MLRDKKQSLTSSIDVGDNKIEITVKAAGVLVVLLDALEDWCVTHNINYSRSKKSVKIFIPMRFYLATSKDKLGVPAREVTDSVSRLSKEELMFLNKILSGKISLEHLVAPIREAGLFERPGFAGHFHDLVKAQALSKRKSKEENDEKVRR